MRAVSPLGPEVVCHIKSPFLLLLQVHSKHQDRGRDYAWQHYSQASRKIAVLLPISVTVIQVQPVLWDAWYILPQGILKQLGWTLLRCSFIVKFPCWLWDARGGAWGVCWAFFWRWLVTWTWWTAQPQRLPGRVTAVLITPRTRTARVLHSSYASERSYLGVSDAPM